MVAAVCEADGADDRLAIVNEHFARSGGVHPYDIDYGAMPVFSEVTCATNSNGENGFYIAYHRGSSGSGHPCSDRCRVYVGTGCGCM